MLFVLVVFVTWCLNSGILGRMDDFRPPKPLSFDGDIATGWQEWRQRFELFLEAKAATGKSDATRIAMLLTAIGPEGIRSFNNFQWATGEDKTKFDHVIQKFETELNGEKRIVFNRYQFWDYKRGDHQMFDDFFDCFENHGQNVWFSGGGQYD